MDAKNPATRLSSFGYGPVDVDITALSRAPPITLLRLMKSLRVGLETTTKAFWLRGVLALVPGWVLREHSLCHQLIRRTGEQGERTAAVIITCQEFKIYSITEFISGLPFSV